MTTEDENELYRLTDMLAAIDADLPKSSPHREALKKAGIALSVAFIHKLRSEIERHFQVLGTPPTEAQLARLRQLGIDPEEH